MRIIDTDLGYGDFKERIYLPSLDKGADTEEYLKRYIAREFSQRDDGVAVYSIPKFFQKTGERQASLAEEKVFNRLQGLEAEKENKKLAGLWMIFFHSASYAGHSFRNHRVGRLMIREHDFVVFATHRGRHFMALIEVKSTNDYNTNISNLEKTSDAKVIKNNKRSAQHQLRDHMEVLQGTLGPKSAQVHIQCYIMWPFLGGYTKDPKHQVIRRWKEDNNLHVFEDTISDQDKFNDWFYDNILVSASSIEEEPFITLLNRFILLSCGVFVDEVAKGIMALLSQEQLLLLHSDICRHSKGKALVVHGAAGTGKTLLVLRKLQQLYQTGRLNDQNRALVICYWPGIRCEIQLKLKALGIENYVDTVRYFITLSDFLTDNQRSYKHILMDETEALCLAFEKSIIHKTLATIYKHYHDGNCTLIDCQNSTLPPSEDLGEKLAMHDTQNEWGELWFMVDTNQAVVGIAKNCPKFLQTPSILLTKVMRSTGCIFDVFKQFYATPMSLPETSKGSTKISIGHHIIGPPIYWVDSGNSIDKAVANVVIDLCSTKGIKPNDMAVIPFLVNEKLIPDSINKHIDTAFVENGYRPRAIRDVEHYLRDRELSDFLIPWALRVKGLEFKVVIMAIDDDDYNCNDNEDRKKVYIMASRCTLVLILVCTEQTRNDIDLTKSFKNYPFGLDLDGVTKETSPI